MYKRQSIRRTVLKEKIQKIYDDSHQNYGAPKIEAELRKSGETITEKTVGNYMRQMGIKAQWIKPYTQTTIDSCLLYTSQHTYEAQSQDAPTDILLHLP